MGLKSKHRGPQVNRGRIYTMNLDRWCKPLIAILLERTVSGLQLYGNSVLPFLEVLWTILGTASIDSRRFLSFVCNQTSLLDNVSNLSSSLTKNIRINKLHSFIEPIFCFFHCVAWSFYQETSWECLKSSQPEVPFHPVSSSLPPVKTSDQSLKLDMFSDRRPIWAYGLWFSGFRVNRG